MRELERFDAMLFDPDGGITSTAEQHFLAWKQTFHEYLRRRAERLDERFEPFQRVDYNRYVDGVPCHDDVRNFLAARRIDVEEGVPDDPPEEETVRGL